MGKPTVGSSTKEAIPVDIEMEGLLIKAGGQDGNKKKKARFFTLGNEMIAYFDCKDLKGAAFQHRILKRSLFDMFLSWTSTPSLPHFADGRKTCLRGLVCLARRYVEMIERHFSY